jgi:GNAT superfamily N-acetyltransferase
MFASKRKPDTLDLYLVGVVPEMQNKGLPAILINAFYETGKKNGIKFVETGPELETNTQVQSLWRFFDATLHKRRRSWKKEF